MGFSNCDLSCIETHMSGLLSLFMNSSTQVIKSILKLHDHQNEFLSDSFGFNLPYIIQAFTLQTSFSKLTYLEVGK